jgi:hypothetical protein
VKQIIVPIDAHSYLGYGSDKDEQENTNDFVLRTFKMPIPTHVKLNLQPSLIDKMKKVKQIMKEQELSNSSFISSFRRDTEHSNVELLYDSKEIIISKYEDFDRLFNTFDNQCFTLTCDSIYKNTFTAQFIYVTSWTEFVFSTSNFSIDEL